MAKFTQQVGKDGKKQPFYKCPNDKVRIELGPQIIKMECTDANLCDTVTSPHYKLGQKDAHGVVIGKLVDGTGGDSVPAVYEQDPKQTHMHCVDWRCKHAPKLWKVYQSQDTGKVVEGDKLRGRGVNKGDKIFQFVKVAEFEDLAEAVSAAQDFIGGAV